MQLQTQRVYLETDDLAIWGTLTFPIVQRLSDALNSQDRRFLALTDVVLAAKSGGDPAEHAFLALAVQHVVLAVPVEGAEEFTARSVAGIRSAPEPPVSG